MRLSYLRDSFPEVPLIACTATATAKVLEDIKTALRLEKSPCYIGSFDRPNVFYNVRYKDSLDNLSSGGASKDLVSFIQKQHARCAKRNIKCSGIVYCHTRADTASLANAIRKETGIKTESYHGGMKADERSRVQHSWTTGESQIAVATVAFGMGIDLAHVRYVIHWNLAKTPEAFYQESGRAGRDGLPSFSLLYYSKDDVSKFQFLLSQRKSDDDGKSATADRELAALKEMVNYCTVPGCRRYRLLKHFGEKIDDPSKSCDTCDYCVNPTRVQQAIEAAMAVGDFVSYKRQPELRAPNPVDDEDDDAAAQDVDSAWEVGGLHVRGNRENVDYESDSGELPAHPSVSFAKASSILSKYEAIECKNSTFVNFKERKDSSEAKSDDRIRIPQHLVPRTSVKSSVPNIEKPKPTSSDFAAEADRLRDELAKACAERAEKQLKLASQGTERRAPPPPPPTVTFSSQRKRKT
jgi:superfamily II DNA/RNA helicase